MTQLILNTNKLFSIDVTARESDEYSGKMFVKFERNYAPAAAQRCDEMFLTPDELRRLGHFLIQQAEMVNINRLMRQDTGA